MSTDPVRNRSRIVRVAGESYDGPCKIEVRTEQWRSIKTGRWFTVWLARKAGAFGWQTARDPRRALARAVFLGDGKRPRWLADATAAARKALA